MVGCIPTSSAQSADTTPTVVERPLCATTNDTEKFTGYFRDAESGNDYAVSNRYMSPGTGRFLTPDRMSGSVADPGGWNKYAYVGGDPINRIDPTGRVSCDPNNQNCVDVVDSYPEDPNPEDCFETICMMIDTPGGINTNCFAYVAIQPGESDPMNCMSAGPASTTPPCPTLSGVASISDASSIIASEVNAALNESEILMKQARQQGMGGDGGNAAAPGIYLNYLDAWAYPRQFKSGGPFDIKSNPAAYPGSDPTDLKNLGNLAYGAVMQALGFSYYEAQNAAGIYQKYALRSYSDGITYNQVAIRGLAGGCECHRAGLQLSACRWSGLCQVIYASKRTAFAIATITFLSNCGNHPSDSNLEGLFRGHREEFAKVLDMMRQDSGFVQTVWLDSRTTSPLKAQLSEERWREYNRLCDPLGVWRISLVNGQLELFVSSIGLLDRGSVKGFLYSEVPPAPVVQNLDMPANAPKNYYKLTFGELVHLLSRSRRVTGTHTYGRAFALKTPVVRKRLTNPGQGNNGKIQSQTDAISGETVTYTYDSLNRLATAENQTGFSPSWGQSFTYDGFGNLTGTSVIKGSAPTMAATYDVNNHAGGEDANGNPGYVPAPAQVTGASAVYDVENRLGTVSEGYTLLMNYSYAPGNKRVWRGNGGSTDEVTFYSVSGRKLGCYQITFTQGTTGYYYTAPQFYYTQTGGVNLYFGGKLIKNKNGWVYPDRLGSIGKYYPYGIERPSATTNDTEKFTGYFRDAESGNDYADQRYESPGTGRFLTSDRTTGNAADPGSWNKYAYVAGDPINHVDPTRREYCNIDDSSDCVPDGVCQDPGQFDNNPGGWLDYCVLGTYYPDGGGGGGGSTGGGRGSDGGSTPGNAFATPGATPQQQAQLDSALQLALGALYSNQKCAKLFGTGVRGNVMYTPSDILNALYELTQVFGSISFGPVGQTRGTVSGGTTLPGVLNTGSAKYNTADITLDPTVWQTDTPQQRAVLLLHELGHAMNDIFGPNTSQIRPDTNATKVGIANSQWNTRLITITCF